MPKAAFLLLDYSTTLPDLPLVMLRLAMKYYMPGKWFCVFLI